MKQTAVEWFMDKIGEKQRNGFYVIDTLQDVQNVFEQAKEMEKQKGYSEEDMVKFVSFVGKNYINAKGFYYMKGDFEKKYKVSIHQILEQFKNK
jgi:hypothetical protein